MLKCVCSNNGSNTIMMMIMMIIIHYNGKPFEIRPLSLKMVFNRLGFVKNTGKIR